MQRSAISADIISLLHIIQGIKIFFGALGYATPSCNGNQYLVGSGGTGVNPGLFPSLNLFASYDPQFRFFYQEEAW